MFQYSLTVSVAQKFDINQTISEKFKGLFPSIPLMIATILAFILAAILLWFLFYKPVKKAMKKRREFIQGNIDDSVKQKEESVLILNQANENLKNAHVQADKIITNAKIKAEKVSDFYRNKAKTEAKRMLNETALDIKAQQKEFEENSKKYIVTVATELSEKILKREMSQQTQDEIVQTFLNTDKEVDEL
ncbi:F-type H+-transporting ATPase subunit b [Mycoplasmopsis mustelae]|uniref:ATP synthase subunit b n=1 Tax=Mycoplasmopsis mustelae TaxID=171289 RepID=A0A4R7UE47_9BACT|nr:F0F1 ATP synthase subunit B [Mycoplasmopsis mustelae]TDV24103.1 F-type H+-transporting ATPase subunit b [Mycoplasmopsis mustelae]